MVLRIAFFTYLKHKHKEVYIKNQKMVFIQLLSIPTLLPSSSLLWFTTFIITVMVYYQNVVARSSVLLSLTIY